MCGAREKHLLTYIQSVRLILVNHGFSGSDIQQAALVLVKLLLGYICC